MSTNVPSPASQVEAQSIAGQPPVQVRPQGLPVAASNSVSGHSIVVSTASTNKGKGNN